MRIKLLIGICLFLLGSGSMAFAQTGVISLDAVDTISTGIVDTGSAITFSIRLNNNSGSEIVGFTNGFRIYSPDGATWVPGDSGAYTGTITNGMAGQQFINPFSVDGSGADTIGFGGFTIFGTGIPDGFDDVVFTMSIASIPASEVGKQICIDSSFYPPGSAWKWSTNAGPALPTWDGPHCFDIVTSSGGTPNEDPVLAPIGDKSVNETELLSFTVTATDAESIPALTSSALPGGATFTDNSDGTASFSWTPSLTQSGAYNITFTATDDSGAVASEAITITVNDAGNQLPVLAAIGPQGTIENTLLNFGVSATDIESTPVLTTSALPTGAVFTDNSDGTGDFVWTPDFTQSGLYPITFYAADDSSAVDSEIVMITVVNVNRDPVLAPIGPQSGPENALLTFGTSATDADGTTPTMTSSTLPTGASYTDNLNGTGTFNWTPDFTQAGAYNVTFYATDDSSAVDSEIVTITISNVNQLPVLAAIGPQSGPENSLLTFGTSASDPDGTTPAMTSSTLPTGASYTDNLNGTGTFNWTPDFTQSGLYPITFYAADDSSAVDSEIVMITVGNVNRDPVLDPIGPQATTETVQLLFSVTASDPDGDIPVLTSSPLPTGATFVGGSFDWTPTIGQAGTHDVTFYATDNLSSTDSETVTITVGPFVPGNVSPVLASIGDQFTDEIVALNFDITASDADGDLTVLSMSAPSLPPGAVFVNNGDDTGSFAWTPTYSDAGSYSATFYAIDTAVTPNDTVSETITITVNNVNRPPVLGTLNDQNIDEGLNLNFGVTVSDADGGSPILWASGLPGTSTFTDNGDGTGTFDWTTTFDDSGSYAVTINTADEADTVSGFLTITVNNINRNPVQATIGDQPTSEGVNLAFATSATDADGDPMTMTMTSPDLPSAAIYTDNGDGTGWFDWTPTMSESGNYSATFRVDDNNSGFDEETITFTVSNVNISPVLSGVTDFQITECDIIMAVFSATDLDGDALTLWVDPLVTNMTFTDNGDGTGDFYFAPSFVQSGDYPATAYATDGTDTVSVGFTVFVADCQPGSLGDTLFIANVPAVPGSRVTSAVDFTNACDISEIHAIIGWESDSIRVDSVSFIGSRVEGLVSKVVTIDNANRTLSIDVVVSGLEASIAVGTGLLGDIHFSLDNAISVGTYAVDPFLIATEGQNPTFVRDCGAGDETVQAFVVPGGIIVGITDNFVCGKVIDTAHMPIPGAVVELWADYPTSGVLMTTTANSFGSFAFDSFTVIPFDLYAYTDGYYPGKAENLNFGQTGVMIMLTPLADIYPTNEWVNFYCSTSTMSGAPLPVGSVVDAYDPDGIRCGTWTVTEESNYGFMNVYGDDQFEPGDQGADPGDMIRLFVNGVEALVNGNNIWTANGDIHEVCLEVSEQVPHLCPLVEGWNLVSWPVDTDNDEISSVLSSISDCIDIVLGFEQGGLTYDPMLPNFSTLTQADHLSGYWIKIKTGCQATLDISGRAVPVTTPIAVTTGWNLVSYLPDTTMLVIDALASIHGDLIVAQGFDVDAQTYVPGDDLHNNLTDLSSCFGYWVKVSQPGNLIYPGSGGPVAPSRDIAIPLAAGINADIAKSNSWMNLYSEELTLNGTAVTSGSMVTAHNSDGMVIGRYTIGDNGLFGFMAVYADDPATDDIEGIRRGETFYLSIDGLRTDENFSWTQTGDRVEIHNLTAKFESGSSLPTTYSLDQNYPNPFNPSTTISFSLKSAGQATLEVYNILGELVARPFDGLAQAGANEVIWDGMDRNGSSVSSGVYFYRLTAGDYSETRKMMLLK